MVTALAIAALLGGLPPIGVSLQPADCPTEAQLSRVLSALGAKLVPFGSPARATVLAQREASSPEWSLTLGRPGHSEQRKVTLAGGCDEQAAALGAIIERFARPVLVVSAPPVPTPDAGTPVTDAGPSGPSGPSGPAAPQVDGWSAPFPVDAGTAAPEAAMLPPPPPPSTAAAAPEPVASEPAPEAAPEPPPVRNAWFVLEARGGAGYSSFGFSGTFGAWAAVKWRIFSLGVGFDYYGPARRDPQVYDLYRPQLYVRWRLIPYLALEGTVAMAFSRTLREVAGFEFPDVSLHPAAAIGVLGSWPLGRFDLWLGLRGWGMLDIGADAFPSLTAELTGGVSVNL
ncbi:MAG: hypothetical protein IPJ65_34955 [Archangiaceae bacterium]|nr:hypothetical protein [Archangiaceae bacterium]